MIYKTQGSIRFTNFLSSRKEKKGNRTERETERERERAFAYIFFRGITFMSGN